MIPYFNQPCFVLWAYGFRQPYAAMFKRYNILLKLLFCFSEHRHSLPFLLGLAGPFAYFSSPPFS